MIAFAVLFSLFHARSKSWNTRAFSIHPSPRDRFLNACQIGANLAKDVDKAELTDFLTGMHLVFPEIADLQDKTQLGFTVEKLNVDAWVAEEFLAIHKEISVFEVEYLFDLMKARAREIS